MPSTARSSATGLTTSYPLSTSTRCTAVSCAIRRNQNPTVWSARTRCRTARLAHARSSSAGELVGDARGTTRRRPPPRPARWSQSSSTAGRSGSRMHATLWSRPLPCAPGPPPRSSRGRREPPRRARSRQARPSARRLDGGGSGTPRASWPILSGRPSHGQRLTSAAGHHVGHLLLADAPAGDTEELTAQLELLVPGQDERRRPTAATAEMRPPRIRLHRAPKSSATAPTRGAPRGCRRRDRHVQRHDAAAQLGSPRAASWRWRRSSASAPPARPGRG